MANIKFPIGIQIMFMEGLLNEGIEKSLYQMKEYGGIDHIFLLANVDFWNTKQYGILPHNPIKKDITACGFYYQYDPKFYDGTIIKPVMPHDKRIYEENSFAKIIDIAHKIGMKSYALILNRFPNSEDFMDCHMVCINGKYIPKVLCHNNPNVRELYFSIVRDILTNQPVDGIFLALLNHYTQFGFQTLTNELAADLGISSFSSPEMGLSCFCKYCVNQAEKEGLNVKNIKRGLLRGIKEGWIPNGIENMTTPDSVFSMLLDIPEYLDWCRYRSKTFTNLHQKIYEIAKTIKPNCEVALDIYGPHDSWKYATNYNTLTKYCDWVKPMFYSSTFPGKALSPDEIRLETSNSKKLAGSEISVIPGILCIINKSEKKVIHDSIVAVFEGGADGIIISWDYSLIPFDHLRIAYRTMMDHIQQ